MGRVDLFDSGFDVLEKLGEGNPGALTVMTNLVQNTQDGIFSLLVLDDNEIYGSDIWGLYKDCCDESMSKFVQVLKSLQQRKITKYVVKQHISARTKLEVV